LVRLFTKGRVIMRALVIVIALVLAASAAFAGLGRNPLNKIAIHVKTHPTSCTDGYPSFPGCFSIQQTYGGCGEVDVMPVFYDLYEFKSVEFGLRLWNDPSLSIFWTRCKGDAAVGTISRSGDGTVITWTTCQRTYSVAPGYGWLTVNEREFVCPVPNPVTLKCGVTDCQSAPGPYFDWSEEYSCAGICGSVGDDPCRPDAADKTSWGAIKAIFR
jgi:hypothetical protein